MRALVVGGGIGGLAAAIALRHAGIEVQVFEREGDARAVELGGGWAIWPNAMRALDELGVGDQVREIAEPFETAHFRTWRGDPLAVWPIGDVARKHGTSAVLITRSELHRVLAGALDEGSPVHLGATFSALVREGSEVVAQFDDSQVERGDLLIGADGAGSVVRKQLFGRLTLSYAGYMSWLATVPFEHRLVRPGAFHTLFGRGARFIFNAVRGGRIYWHAAFNAPEHGAGGDADPNQLLLDRYRDWAEPLQAMISATGASSITRLGTYTAAPQERWVDGRVALLGDAAHPITFDVGQGAAQAFEDAVVLARSLRAEPDDVPSALRRYEQRRKNRAASFQRLARRLGNMGQLEGRLACAARDRVIRMVFPRIALKQQERDLAAYRLP